VLILALLSALLASDTPIGKAVRALLIDSPAKADWRTTPFRILVRLIVMSALVAFIVGAIVSGPEWIMLFGLGDLTIYLDVGAILLLTSVAAWGRLSLTRVVHFARNTTRSFVARRNRRRGRTRVSHLRKPRSPSSSDDEAGCAWAFA